MTDEPARQAERDRDETGRARNARPRDELGRPLPHGSAGVEPVPDDLRIGPDEGVGEAQRLLDAGRPFQAHEVLEAVWKQSPEPERDLWRGLAQLAVGLTHQRRGNAPGAAALLRRGAENVAPWSGAQPYGVEVAQVVAWAQALAADVETGAASYDVPLRLSGTASSGSATPSSGPIETA